MRTGRSSRSCMSCSANASFPFLSSLHPLTYVKPSSKSTRNQIAKTVSILLLALSVTISAHLSLRPLSRLRLRQLLDRAPKVCNPSTRQIMAPLAPALMDAEPTSHISRVCRRRSRLSIRERNGTALRVKLGSAPSACTLCQSIESPVR